MDIYICKWLDIEVFSDKDLSERVGDEIPGVVVYLSFHLAVHAWVG